MFSACVLRSSARWKQQAFFSKLRGVYGIPSYGKRSLGEPQGKPGLPSPLEAPGRRTTVHESQQYGPISRGGCLCLAERVANGGERQTTRSKERYQDQAGGQRLIRDKCPGSTTRGDSHHSLCRETCHLAFSHSAGFATKIDTRRLQVKMVIRRAAHDSVLCFPLRSGGL